MVEQLKSRLAPTPSGFLHIGNAFSFVLTWVIVKSRGGKLHLRIDDGDSARFRPEYLDDIFETLHWLGINWDSGATNSEDFIENYSQQSRQAEFAELGNELEQVAEVYTCSCSRKEIKQYWPGGLHLDRCNSFTETSKKKYARRLSVEPSRINIPDIVNPIEISPAAAMGDVVIRKKDGAWAYQVCSLAEDFNSEINLIVRGEDLLNSTALQLYMADKLSNSNKPDIAAKAARFLQASYLHHPLLLDTDGNKLSKSAGSTSIRHLRIAGATPDIVYAQVARYLNVPLSQPNSIIHLLQAAQESQLINLLPA
jgi:glutamyl-tRNA synthetase